jgi:hypothetical protein
MAQDDFALGRHRALMTETDRKHITGLSDPTQDQKDQSTYRVRQRVIKALSMDVEILEQHRPEIAAELKNQVCDSPPLASGIAAYVAIANYPETGDWEVLFDGEPIEHVAYDNSSSDTLRWGYPGAGPTNTARTILEHACDELNVEQPDITRQTAVEFRQEFIQQQDDNWTLPLSAVELWISENV